MGWGNTGLSWTRYAKSPPTRNCVRCHLDYAEAEGSCPHCGQLDDRELQHFLGELAAKKKKNTRLFIALVAVLLLYVVAVLLVLPAT